MESNPPSASGEEGEKPHWRSAIRQPAVISILCALLVVLGVGAWAAMRKLDDFPGRDLVGEIIDETDGMDGTELEPVTPIEAAQLGDWFMLKGFEGYTAPVELAVTKAVGCRVYRHDDHPVAQIALDRKNALLAVFHTADMKVTLSTSAWHIFQQDDWAVATRGDGANGYIVSFIGDADEMAAFLRGEAGASVNPQASPQSAVGQPAEQAR
jgi:hypothetical protein